MQPFVEGTHYSLLRIRAGNYVVRNAADADIGIVAGWRKKWAAFDTVGTRIGVDATRSGAATLLLTHVMRAGDADAAGADTRSQP
ncbi:hypothetical protein [Burkholderia sp. Ac-20365]|uniref:hypothetical protein n=1 Tax=Burkholderia sp. Ac-20365 TaxID=2703897 RepID=UPI00197B4882|nr:hypothetical protein [Burkholderia sp. Ac-20365]MBN3760930.1 hypothetical protein [Burkholderia sp. Ac-20365]